MKEIICKRKKAVYDHILLTYCKESTVATSSGGKIDSFKVFPSLKNDFKKISSYKSYTNIVQNHENIGFWSNTSLLQCSNDWEIPNYYDIIIDIIVIIIIIVVVVVVVVVVIIITIIMYKLYYLAVVDVPPAPEKKHKILLNSIVILRW